MEFVIQENLLAVVHPIVIQLPPPLAYLVLRQLPDVGMRAVRAQLAEQLSVQLPQLRRVEQAQCNRFGINCSGFNFLFAGTY